MDELKAKLCRAAENMCGSCDTPVVECEHRLFVPTCDWVEAQEELEGQINDKQRVGGTWYFVLTNGPIDS